jgi:CBS domain-containing protein
MRLEEDRRHKIRVEDIMTPDVLAVGPRTSLGAVIQLFINHSIAGAPVIDETGQPLGMVTSTDLLDPSRCSDMVGDARYYRLWRGDVRNVGVITENDARPRGVVEDVMTHAVVTIDERSSVRDAALLMAKADLHRLVVTRNGRACGVVTAMDCLKALASARSADAPACGLQQAPAGGHPCRSLSPTSPARHICTAICTWPCSPSLSCWPSASPHRSGTHRADARPLRRSALSGALPSPRSPPASS